MLKEVETNIKNINIEIKMKNKEIVNLKKNYIEKINEFLQQNKQNEKIQ